MSDPVLQAASYLAAIGATPELATDVVLVFDDELVPRRGRARRPAPFRAIAPAPGSATSVVLAAGPGGPTAAVTVDLLAHLGVEAVVAVGAAAALRSDVDTGTIVVPTRARTDEHLSARYGGHLLPDLELAEALTVRLGATTGTTITTDAPLRQTAEDVARLANEGLVFEMECAVIFAAAHQHGMRAAAALVVSDHLLPAGWTIGSRTATADSLQRALVAAGTTLRDGR